MNDACLLTKQRRDASMSHLQGWCSLCATCALRAQQLPEHSRYPNPKPLLSLCEISALVRMLHLLKVQLD